MPYEHVRLEGGHQFVAGTIFQGDVHRYIIRKGLVLERLDRLVMLDDFGLFHIFCLDVLLQLVIFATGQVETFYCESIDGLTIVIDTTILLYIHAWQLFQYILQTVVSFVGKAGEVERYGIPPCDTRAFYLYFLQDKSC